MRISEDFYSIQGEGFSQGVPAYFIRLQGCNLMCGGVGGEKVKSGEATWWCDTEAVWKQGKRVSNEELVDRIQEAGQLEQVLDGVTHMVWTGGEPTLPLHVSAITGFVNYMRNTYDGNSMFNEIETNATVHVKPYFYQGIIQQVNSSPKLSNSGVPDNMRINPRALKQVADHYNGWFKFVVTHREDVFEIKRDFIRPYNLPQSQVILMPGVDNLKELPEKTKLVYELAKEFGYRATTRGQILAWDKTTGV
ncbi:7-carboxy-7-deazaguanine synthase QueE [Patescibacteria group bacterium]|nr:7-carboxy-7-deazaguanine synthase QueE [Patescibacteria group bacterium]